MSKAEETYLLKLFMYGHTFLDESFSNIVHTTYIIAAKSEDSVKKILRDQGYEDFEECDVDVGRNSGVITELPMENIFISGSERILIRKN